tara:strand:- start:901 stop:2415 length:1515 start_codon:yes stop_codon:yes gene_type:complete
MANMCIKKDLLIVVPYRNREEHLKGFLENSPKYFDQQRLTYDILICELDQKGDWNAGLCVNSVVDFVDRGKEYEWLYIHHVDVWPTEGQWLFPKGKEVFFNLGDYGSCLMNMETFFEVKGYSNDFWGWGGEDNDLYMRLRDIEYTCVDVSSNHPVKYNTEFQKHERKFNGSNYANGLKNLMVHSKKERNDITNFSEHGYTKDLSLTNNNIYKHIVVPKKVSPDQAENKKLLITYSQNITQFNDAAAFVKSSVVYAAYDYDVVVVVGDETPDDYYLNQLEAHGAIVYKCKTKINNIFINRHNAFKEFLESNPNYEYVLHVDLTDVYFQDNPFRDLDPLKVTFVSEDIEIKNQLWNYNTLRNIYPSELVDSIQNEDVICCGVFGAPRNLFIEVGEKLVQEYKDLKFGIDTGNEPMGIDQPFLIKNIYVDKLLNQQIDLKHTWDRFCVNLHVFKHEPEFVSTKITISDKKVLNQNGERFAIVHQYNRYPDLYTKIRDHFTRCFEPIR